MKKENEYYYQALVAELKLLNKMWLESIVRLMFDTAEEHDEAICKVMNEIRRLERE